MATVPPTRLAPSAPRFPIPVTPSRFRLPAVLQRISSYSILLAVIHPTMGIALAVATLRAHPDAAAARRARTAIAVGAGAWLAYAAIMAWMVSVCIDLVTRLAALGAFA